MNTKRLLIGIALAAMVINVEAQTIPTPSPELKSDVITFIQNVESNRSITIAAYPMYAPDIVVNGKKDTFGMGLALLAPADTIPALQGTAIGNHAFAGLRFDYLAHEAFASTVGVGIRGSMQLWSHNFDGFVHAGANIPFSGFGSKNTVIGAMAGGGVHTDIYRFTPHAVLGLQVSVEKWTQFPGIVGLGGPMFSWDF